MGIITSDSVTFITGAGSGFGRAILLEFVRSGGRKFIICDLHQSSIDETIQHAKSLDSSVEVHSAITDVSDANAVEALVKAGVEKFGRIDHSIHCAGVAGEMGPTSEASVENYQKVMDVNVKGVWVCSKYVLAQMKKQEPRKTEHGIEVRGSVVNIASLLGLIAHPNCSAYVGSKHAVVGISKSDAADGAQHGIRVNAICPGYCRTNLLSEQTFDHIDKMVQATCPTKRLGLPEEIANVIVFLASDKASFVTGAAVAADGGLTAV